VRVACDIDGVLADVREHVEKYLLKGNDWRTYFKHTSGFPTIREIGRLVSSLYLQFWDVYFVTGRPESNRGSTEDWLSKTILPGLWFPYSLKLLMRPEGDVRATSDIKMEWFRKICPDLVIDDDPKLIQIATGEGFVVLQVHGFRCTDRDQVPFEEVKNV